MINYREILRLHSLGYSQRRIESSVRSSHQTVKSVLEKAKAQGISWPLEPDVTNAMLEELLSDKEQKGDSPYAEPDFAYIHNELSKKGVTRAVSQKYYEKCRTNGQQPYMSTQFGDKYRRWARVTKATMCIIYSSATLCRLVIGQTRRFRIMTPLLVKNTRHVCLFPRYRAAFTSTRHRAEI